MIDSLEPLQCREGEGRERDTSVLEPNLLGTPGRVEVSTSEETTKYKLVKIVELSRSLGMFGETTVSENEERTETGVRRKDTSTLARGDPRVERGSWGTEYAERHGRP